MTGGSGQTNERGTLPGAGAPSVDAISSPDEFLESTNLGQKMRFCTGGKELVSAS